MFDVTSAASFRREPFFSRSSVKKSNENPQGAIATAATALEGLSHATKSNN
jgi:hypothetical protein